MNKIREYRTRIKGASLAQAAKDLGISVASLCRKEKGEQAITPQDAIRFEKWSNGFLRWTIEELAATQIPRAQSDPALDKAQCHAG